MSALYFLPLTMPSRVGFFLSLKFRVTSYTAVTETGGDETERMRGEKERSNQTSYRTAYV